MCLSVGDNITELKRLSSNPRIITCKPSCFQAAFHLQEILYLGETTRIISFQTQHLHLHSTALPAHTSLVETVHTTDTAKSGCTVRPVYRDSCSSAG